MRVTYQHRGGTELMRRSQIIAVIKDFYASEIVLVKNLQPLTPIIWSSSEYNWHRSVRALFHK